LRAKQFDLIWIEKEAFPWLPGWLDVILTCGVPYIVDFDDAQFHRYDQHSSQLVRRILGLKIDRLMRHATLIIAGNKYLAQRAWKAGAARVEILPTVIDLHRYPKAPLPQNSIFTIGWIGSLSTFKHLQDMQSILQVVCQDGDAQMVAIGPTASDLQLEGVPLTVKPWSGETEVQELQQFDVGIMPLPDKPWERRKCGFKLIQYMACSCPIVGSPVGVNQDIIEQGITGFQASNAEEWIKALVLLKQDKELRKKLGAAGRQKVEQQYCLQVTAPKLTHLLNEVNETELKAKQLIF